MPITLAQLRAAMPDCGVRASLFLPHLNAAMAEFDISTEPRIEMFLATLSEESGDLQHVEENLNYSAAGLCKTWPSRFPTLASAQPYARNPQKIANRVYANRMGNSGEASGMGWLYRGAGLIQLTGYTNQKRCADHFGIPVHAVNAWLRSPEGACRSAAWFWQTAGCNELADRGDFDGVCDRVNIGRTTATIGDAVGYSNRLANLTRAQRAI